MLCRQCVYYNERNFSASMFVVTHLKRTVLCLDLNELDSVKEEQGSMTFLVLEAGNSSSRGNPAG